MVAEGLGDAKVEAGAAGDAEAIGEGSAGRALGGGGNGIASETTTLFDSSARGAGDGTASGAAALLDSSTGGAGDGDGGDGIALGAASLLDSSTGGAGDGAVASRRAEAVMESSSSPATAGNCAVADASRRPEAVKESSNPPATAGTCKPRHALTDISGSRRLSESRG
jgi:hypothetical protein